MTKDKENAQRLVEETRNLLANMPPEQRLVTLRAIATGYCEWCGEVQGPYHASRHF